MRPWKIFRGFYPSLFAKKENREFEFLKLLADKIDAWSIYNHSIDDDIIEYNAKKPYETMNKIIELFLEKKNRWQKSLST